MSDDVGLALASSGYYPHFGRRLLQTMDRLGSVNGGYYPWGQEQGTITAGNPGFTGYIRDVPGGGQDYAEQRYYNANYGRFWSPDPLGAPNLKNPTSWNRYAYPVTIR